MSMHEPPLDDVGGLAGVPRQVGGHHLGRAPRFALTREVEVLNVGEAFAHRHPGAQPAVEVQVLRVQGSVHFGKNQNFAKTRKFLIQDVHVEILEHANNKFSHKIQNCLKITTTCRFAKIRVIFFC